MLKARIVIKMLNPEYMEIQGALIMTSIPIDRLP